MKSIFLHQCRHLDSFLTSSVFYKMWKAKQRTGGIRRKINAEYLKIIKGKAANAGKNQQPTSSMSHRENITANQVFENSGCVSRNNVSTERHGLNCSLRLARAHLDLDVTDVSSEPNISYGPESASAHRLLDEAGSVCNIYDDERTFTDYPNDSDSSDISDCDIHDKKQEFQSKIKKWAISKNIAQTALNDLAKIINDFVPNTLPNDSRTILGSPRIISLKKIDGGEYWHNGIMIPLKKILLYWDEAPENITLNINFDGLPIFKSSKSEFWPILCNIFENPCIRPFVIGIYFGQGKPKSVTEYLEDFIDEIKILLVNGIYVQSCGRKLTIKIRCFICDSPARAYIKGVCNFNGRHGCLKCVTVGEYSHISHTVVFPDTRCPERTNERFRNKQYGAHHKSDSPLLCLPIDRVTNFPVGDSLHLIDLGIMKRLLIGWRDGNFGKHITKWRASDTESVTKFLNQCKLPSEIHGAVRGLDSLAFWKASEFRSFFYYLSIVILPDVLNPDAFSHFLTLYCGITICSNKAYQHLLPLAEQLLRYFVENYKDFYGAAYVTSNVHNLLHVTAEVEMYGTLDSFSAYPFENKLYMIKRMLRDGKNPLSQVAKRLTEDEDNIGMNIHLEQKRKTKYPFISKSKKELRTLHFRDFILSSKTKDRYLLTVQNDIVEIESIEELSNIVSIKCFQLNNKEEVFVYPIKSSRFGIFKSYSLKIGDTSVVVLNPKDIKCKLVCIPHKEYHFFIPLGHTV